MKILLIILAVLLFLLLAPLTVELAYQEELTLKVRYLFLKLNILPMVEKEEKPEDKPKKAKKKKESPEEKPKKKKKFSLDFLLEILELAKQALSSLRNPLGYFLRHIHYRDLWLHILVAREDAHQTALRYGQCQAVIHSVFSPLRNCVDVKTTDIQIQADFIGEEEKFAGGGKLKLRPAHALIFAFWFLGSFAIGYLRRKHTESKLQKELKKQCENKQTTN